MIGNNKNKQKQVLSNKIVILIYDLNLKTEKHNHCYQIDRFIITSHNIHYVKTNDNSN